MDSIEEFESRIANFDFAHQDAVAKAALLAAEIQLAQWREKRDEELRIGRS